MIRTKVETRDLNRRLDSVKNFFDQGIISKESLKRVLATLIGEKDDVRFLGRNFIVNEMRRARDLADAVNIVIKQNRDIGYPPNRFANKLAGGDLRDKVFELLTKESARAAVIEAITIKGHRNLLTIEDFVATQGSEWGFSPSLIVLAQERVSEYNREAKRERVCILPR